MNKNKNIMENKLNIANLLKDCPKGMELDCTLWDSEAKVFLESVLDDDSIEVTVKYNNIENSKSFTKYGAFNDLPYCKCVIFPKGKTTWEGFVPPCKFKDGDILATDIGSIFILKEPNDKQDNWELVPNKFDIVTLKPFDKVLARDNDSQKWSAELFSFYDNESEDYRFQLVGVVYARCCIPYEGNEHLLGKTDNCDEFYKTWA